MFGKKGATYGLKPGETPTASWARLTQDAGLRKKPGQSPRSLVMDRPVDWQVGDKIVVTTTDYLPSHSELHEIRTIKTDDNQSVITTVDPLQYLHNGQKIRRPGEAPLHSRRLRSRGDPGRRRPSFEKHPNRFGGRCLWKTSPIPGGQAQGSHRPLFWRPHHGPPGIQVFPDAGGGTLPDGPRRAHGP